jgi:hypothetical protein
MHCRLRRRRGWWGQHPHQPQPPRGRPPRQSASPCPPRRAPPPPLSRRERPTRRQRRRGLPPLQARAATCPGPASCARTATKAQRRASCAALCAARRRAEASPGCSPLLLLPPHPSPAPACLKPALSSRYPSNLPFAAPRLPVACVSCVAATLPAYRDGSIERCGVAAAAGLTRQRAERRRHVGAWRGWATSTERSGRGGEEERHAAGTGGLKNQRKRWGWRTLGLELLAATARAGGRRSRAGRRGMAAGRRVAMGWWNAANNTSVGSAQGWIGFVGGH